MNRCRHDVIDDMLRALSTEPKKITDLCSSGNLPVDRGKRIVQTLEKFGLIYEVDIDGNREFKLTDRGYEWMGLYRLLKKNLP